MAKIKINDSFFHTPIGPQGAIIPYPVQPLGEAFRLQGSQRRVDNRKINRYIFDNWHEMGIGWTRMRRESGRGVGGMRDADAETRFGSQITLPILAETETHAQEADHLVKYIEGLGYLWGVFTERRNGDGAGNSPTDLIVTRQYDHGDDTWKNGGTVDTAANVNPNGCDPIRAFDACIHKNRMYVVYADDVNGTNVDTAYQIKASNDAFASDNNDVGGTNWPDGSSADFIPQAIGIRRNFDDDYARLLDFDSNIIVALFEDPDSTDGSEAKIHVGYSANVGGTWTFNSGLVISTNLGEAGGPKALVTWYDRTNTLRPMLFTRQAMYSLDISNNTFTEELKLTGGKHDGRGAAVGDDQNLYIPITGGDIWQVSRGSAVSANEFSYVVTNIGPFSRSGLEANDGLIAERQGHANKILPKMPWLYVAYGGHAADKHASIFCYHYRTGAWHSFYRDGTANRDIYDLILTAGSDDTGVLRLHAATEGTNASVMVLFEEPTVPSVTGVAQKFASSGYVEWAEDDLGDPHSSAAVLQALISAEDITNTATSSSGEYIEHEYTLDEATTTWTDVSNFGYYIKGDSKLQFGKTLQNISGQTEAGTPIGVSAKTIRNKLVFNRDSTNTKTPKLKEFELQARNKVLSLEGFRVPIDIGLTAQEERIRPSDVVARINTIIDNVTLVTFDKDRDDTRYVECAGTAEANLRSVEQAANMDTEEFTGVITLLLEEVMP